MKILGDKVNKFDPTLLMIDPTIKSIRFGGFHTLILKESNDLFVCGWNHQGNSLILFFIFLFFNYFIFIY